MESSTGIFGTIAQFFAHGGFWMWPIFVAQTLSLAIIAERVFALYFQRKGNQDQLARGLEDEIKKGNLDSVIMKARQAAHAGNPLGTVIAAGTQAALNMGGREEIQAKMDEVLLAENSRLQQRTSFLAMLGNVGTLLGLLGTIVGMIRSFAAITAADPVQKANILASGISEAMNATAYGLICAIPALVMFTVLQNRSHRLFEELNQGALKIFNLLSFHYETVPLKKTRAGK